MSGLRNILIEGRIEDAKNLIRKHYLVDEEGSDYMYLVDYLVDKDPSGNNKYLMWMVKRMLDDNEDTRDNTEGALIELVTDFHELLPKISNALAVKVFGTDSDISISPKNIDSYPTTHFLQKIVDAAREHESRKQVEVQAKSGADKVYEDKRWVVVRPDTKEASCYYGAGTKWCTAMKTDNQHFDNYTRDGRLYYIIDKSRDLGRYYKVALYRKFGDQRNDHGTGSFNGQWFDEKDERLGTDTLEVITALLPQQLSTNIDKDFKNEEDNAVTEFPSHEEFAEKFVEWVKRKYPNGTIIESLSGPWALQAFIGEGYEKPYIAMSSRKYEGYVNIGIFDDTIGDIIQIDLDMTDKYDETLRLSERVQLGSIEFDETFWNFNLETVTDSNLQSFYNQLIKWWVKKELLDNSEVVERADLDTTYWQHYGHSGRSLKFHYPPRKGTMTQLLTDYVIKNPGKTRQEFYRDVLKREHTPGHNTTFFGGIISSGIIRGERGKGRGRGMKFYKGPNYDAWKEGKLKRI